MAAWSVTLPESPRAGSTGLQCENNQPPNSKQSWKTERPPPPPLVITRCSTTFALVLALAVALAASACAFFLASFARRLRSASLLPLATRPAFLAGFVCGGSAVTLTCRRFWWRRCSRWCWCGCGCWLFGNCVKRCRGHRVYIGFKVSYNSFCRDSCNIRASFLLANCIQAFEGVTVLVSAGVRGLW